MTERLRRVERPSCWALAALLVLAWLAARRGHDTVFGLAFHPLVVGLGVLALLCCSFVRGGRALVGALVTVAALAVALPCLSNGTSGHEILDIAAPGGRYHAVATLDEGEGLTHFWIERHDGVLVRRVPAGCTTSSSWGLAPRDATHLVIKWLPTGESPSGGDRVLDAPALIARGGTDSDCA